MTTSGAAGAWLHEFGSLHLTVSAPEWIISNGTQAPGGTDSWSTDRFAVAVNVSLSDVSLLQPNVDVMCALRWGNAWHPGVPCAELPFVDRLSGGRPD